MKKLAYIANCFLLFACSTDYGNMKYPQIGEYYSTILNEKIIIVDTIHYIHVYNNNKRDIGTYKFYPGIKEVNFWGELRLKNFNNTNPKYNKCRIQDMDSSVIYSLAYSFESYYTDNPVIVLDIDEVNQGFNYIGHGVAYQISR